MMFGSKDDFSHSGENSRHMIIHAVYWYRML